MGELMVVLIGKLGVFRKQGAGAPCQIVGADTALGGVQAVLSRSDIKLIDDGRRLERIQDQLKKSIAVGGREFLLNLFRFFCNGLLLGADPVRLLKVDQAECVRLQLLRLSPSVVLGVFRNQICNLRGMFRAEIARRP